MKKIHILIILLAFLFQQNNAVAQSKEKAEKAFLKELNIILKNSPSQHWSYNASSMSIDTPFAINPKGILSVTVRYLKDDSSSVRARMEAPISKVDKVLYDLYLILGTDKDDVIVYESGEGSEILIETSRSNLFHIGEPVGDGYYVKEKLQKLLNLLLKYYKK